MSPAAVLATDAMTMLLMWKGVLVPALDTEDLPQHGYYLCQPDVATPSRTVSEFREWMLKELIA